MPTYDYVCDACQHAFEEFQSMTAAPLKKCPACSKNKLRRLIGTGAGIIFKGSGFYETDYRSEGYKRSQKAESDASSPKETKTEGKSEGKSDAKSESTPAPKAEAAKPAKPEKPANKKKDA